MFVTKQLQRFTLGLIMMDTDTMVRHLRTKERSLDQDNGVDHE